MAQALYRKYRSKNLAEMVGQEHVTNALAGSIKSGRISHAYLFTGPRGTGKTSAARILAHQINNLPYTDDTQHLDIIEIDAASNRRIDDIRDLRDRVHIAPTSAAYKVYIIDEVHMLTGESFNALLKTLEEPPEHVVFILATTEIHKLPATIVSRTQRYNFRLIDIPKVIGHLKHIAEQEKITIDDEALELVAEHGEGCFRDSINLLDQLANVNNGKIDAAAVERSLGLAPKKAIQALADAVAKKDHQAITKQLNELDQQGVSPAALLPQIIRQLQTEATKHPELFTLIDQLLDVPRAFNPRLKLLTTLICFTLPQGASTMTATSSSPPSAPAKPTPVATKPALTVEKPSAAKTAPPAQAAQKPKPKTSAPAEPQHASGEKITGLTDEQWGTILAQIKLASAPFFGILRQAQPVFDAASQTLTLKFRYALHSKRADDAKSKKLLADTMLNLLGGAPIINTEVDAAAAAPGVDMPAPEITPEPTPPSEQQPSDDVDTTTKSVMDIMGGGELVNA